MAIYSLNHSSIGRSTHAPGTAGAHVGYITRQGAHAEVVAERMPSDPTQARDWMEQAEVQERKNGRVCDKVMVALPRELSAEQQTELVRAFAEDVTQGRASWIAAIHRDDTSNPHAHVVIRDKDPETGKRVARLSEKGSTERLRLAWEQAANAALLGKGVQIDRRSLKAQGIDRTAQIHVGPRAKAMVERGVEPVTKTRTDHRGRKIRYLQIESLGSKTKTRAGYNAKIINLNEQKAKKEAQKWDLSHWENAVETARKTGFGFQIERAEIHLQVAKEFVAAKKPLPHSGGQITEIGDSRWNALESDRRAVERAQQEKVHKGQEDALRAQEARKTALADRYEASIRIAEKTAKAAEGAKWQKGQIEKAHPWRTRLHKIGLKFGPLAAIEDRIEAAQKAKNALEADPEGKRAYEAREADRKAQEAVRQEQARQYQQKLVQERQKAQEKPKGPGRDDPGLGFGR